MVLAAQRSVWNFEHSESPMLRIFSSSSRQSSVPTRSSDDLVAKERELLDTLRAEGLGLCGDQARSGIALSGGGIRAATFALGVLQAFAAKNLLSQFDYISSVSGGGYIAASLQWWWSQKRETSEASDADSARACGQGAEDFPYGFPFDYSAAPPTLPIQRARLSYLLNHASYLVPGDGINFYSMLAVIARTQLISVLIVIPLLSIIFYTLELANIVISSYYVGDARTLAQTGAEPSALNAILKFGIDEACLFDTVHCIFKFNLLAVSLLSICALLPLLFVFLSIAASLSTPFNRYFGDASRTVRWAFLIIVCLMVMFAARLVILFGNSLNYIPTVVVFVFAGYGLIIGFQIISTTFRGLVVSSSYWFRRNSERQVGRLIPLFSACITLGTLPLVSSFIFKYISDSSSNGKFIGIFGAVGAVSGVASAFHSIYAQAKRINPGLASRLFSTIGSSIFIYSIIITAYAIGVYCAEAPIKDDIGRYIIVGGIMLSISLGLFADLNQTGLHRFYRDRLMETFMPTTAAVKAGRSQFSPTADSLLLSDLFSQTGGRSSRNSVRPYPIINTNVILTGEKTGKYRQRGGDNFVPTPLFVGSQATGWQRTESYISLNGPLTLASAMAASGAAANGNAAYLGSGITRVRH
jgi:hypothetical protein